MRVGAGGCGWVRVGAGGCGWVRVGAGGCGWVRVGAGGCGVGRVGAGARVSECGQVGGWVGGLCCHYVEESWCAGQPIYISVQ